MFIFIGGGPLLFGPPQCISLGESGPPDPPGNQRACPLQCYRSHTLQANGGAAAISGYDNAFSNILKEMCNLDKPKPGAHAIAKQQT